MIIEWSSRANGERRAPGGEWWIGLAEIDHETSDFCNVDVDLNKGVWNGFSTHLHAHRRYRHALRCTWKAARLRRRLGGEHALAGGILTIRRAWTMKLKPGAAEQYRAMHDAIWPEMLERMRAGGVHTFSIYRDGLTLFAYQEFEAADRPGLEPDATIRRWWRSLEPLMECQADGQPLRQELDEVFHFPAQPHLGARD